MTFEKCERYPKQYLGTIHTLIIDGRLSFYNAEHYKKFVEVLQKVADIPFDCLIA